jgi:hypothetical protein
LTSQPFTQPCSNYAACRRTPPSTAKASCPLLADPDAAFPPALTTHLRGNHALRSGPWRYIRYADGTEELYNHTADPDEWTNLAADPKYKSVIDGLRPFLPKANAAPAPEMKMPPGTASTEYKPK